MALPQFLRLPGEIGERFSGAFVFGKFMGDDLMELRLIGTNLHVLFPRQSCPERFTLYDAIVLEREPMFLSQDDRTLFVPHEGPPETFQVKEVCAGIGGLGLGATIIGFPVVAVLDSNPLACAHLVLNHIGKGNVLCRNLCDDSAKGELHVAGGIQASLLAAGFPCQPSTPLHSRFGGRFQRPQTSSVHRSSQDGISHVSGRVGFRMYPTSSV